MLLREAKDLAARMSLDPDRVLTSYQHELSGGMRQRVNIIFALVMRPQVILLDEPTTALDVLSQSAVLEIVRNIQRERKFTVILITHDMGVVAELSHRVVVMYAGRVMERGVTTEVLRHSTHPYTRALLRAIPRLTGDVALAQPLAGLPPSLATIPTQGCVFRDRCPHRMAVCDEETPHLQTKDGEQYVAQDGDVCVIYRGEIVEYGAADEVIQSPVHPYTQALLSAMPVLRGLEEPGPDRYIPKQTLEASGGDGGACSWGAAPSIPSDAGPRTPIC